MKKKMFAVAMAAALMTGAAWAGDACCGAKSAAGASCPMTSKSDGFSKLGLNDEQKGKVAALRAECDKAGRTPESCQAFMKGLKDVLTPEQWTKWESTVKAKGPAGGGCPVSQGASKK